MIIAIAGGTGSGKTTISKALQEKYSLRFNIRVEVISMDDYYKNEHYEKFENYDHPYAFDTDLLYEDLYKFTSSGNIQLRSYDYVTKKRKLREEVSGVQVLIVEGLYSFYERRIRDICNITLYLDIDEHTRIKRRLLRDLEDREIQIEDNMTMINTYVKKMHEQYVVKQKLMADKSFNNCDDVLRLVS